MSTLVPDLSFKVLSAVILVTVIHQIESSPTDNISDSQFIKRESSQTIDEDTHAIGIREKREDDGLNNVGSCRSHNQCDIYQWCSNNKCKNPCRATNCKQTRPDSICRIEDHLPVCKTEDELTPEQLYENNGCLSNEECGEDQWCMHHKCEDACIRLDCGNWAKVGYCQVIDHNPVCTFKTFEHLSEDKEEHAIEQRPAGDPCLVTFECEHHLVCIEDQCQDPCEHLWCMTEGIDNPGFLVSKTEHPMENYFNDKYNCVIEHHVIKCVPDE